MRCANVWRSKVPQEEAMPKWHMKAGDGGPVDMNDVDRQVGPAVP